MTLPEKKRLQIIIVVIVGVPILFFGSIRIQGKINSILQTQPRQLFQIDSDFPVFEKPGSQDYFDQEELMTEEELRQFLEEELGELSEEEFIEFKEFFKDIIKDGE